MTESSLAKADVRDLPQGFGGERILSARTFLDALFRHLPFFLSVFVGTLTLVVLASILSTKQYRSETKFLLENSRSDAIISAGRNASEQVPQITEEEVNSELELIGSDDVLGAVADPGWSQLRPNEKTGLVLKEHSLHLRKIRGHLRIESARKSNIITVSYSAPSPEEATRTLEQLSNAYLAHRKRLARPSGTSAFFDEESDRYQKTWEDANSRLADFQRDHQLISVSEKEDLLAKAIAETEEDLRTSQEELSELDGRLRAGRAAARSLPQRHPTESRLETGQVSTEQLRALLVQLQNKRTELLNRYQPTDRLVQEVNKQIADTSSSLAALLAQQAAEQTTDVNPSWQQAQSSVVEDNMQQNALKDKVATISAQLTSLRAQLKDLQDLEVPFSRLEENADQARSNFELYSEKRDQSQIEDAMDAHQIANVAIAEAPTLAFRPSSPKLFLNIALGFVSALLLVFVLIYLVEALRCTLLTPREVEAFSRYPVLATVPTQTNTFPRNLIRGSRRGRGLYGSGATIFTSGHILVQLKQNFDTPEES